ncbi:peptidase M23-like protein [Gramella sp. Hel_I_59]|uniref:M23 family metallopeptidase n=1 Tax=Gramella sp. Hel_I_59 TaxID=1249978 RepID=UPI001150F38C|nr:M23 family metallopeptidase [Gramella sp. Hel_I_59]TQI71306.1 peptidase M23-like protein [Gramella sp. Hel_I_59]
MTWKYLFLSILVSFMFYTPNSNAQLPDIEIMHERRGDKSIEFSYRKNKPGTYYLKLEFPDLKNTNHGDHKQILDHDYGNLTVLRAINREEEIGYSYTFSYIRGIPNPEVDSTFKYLLPLKTSETARIVETSQQNAEENLAMVTGNWISYIITKGESFPVHAMREGVVVEVRNSSADSISQDVRNSIIIEHKDGTYANYQGLEEIKVLPGEEVYPNQYLGDAQKFEDQKHRLDFSVNYIYSEKFEGNRQNALKQDEANFNFLKPIFYAKDYSGVIDSGKEYTMEMTQEIFTQDFSKRDLRRFKKNPSQFNWTN